MKQKQTNVEPNYSKKIREGDRVRVLAGNSKNQMGTVLRVIVGQCNNPKAKKIPRYTNTRVIVQGLNLQKKHAGPSKQYPKGGIIEIEGSIHISNVCPCDEDGKKLKLKVFKDSNGERQLYRVKDGERALHRSLKSKLA